MAIIGQDMRLVEQVTGRVGLAGPLCRARRAAH
ncbi:hypothetical protein [Streptomyces sp. NPDC087859]